MEIVATFSRGEDAHLFRSFLISEAIDAYVYDEYIPQLFWHYTQAIGGVRVAVADDDLERATELYKGYIKAIQEGPSVVEEVRYWPIVLIASLVLGAPFMLFGRKGFKNDDRSP